MELTSKKMEVILDKAEEIWSKLENLKVEFCEVTGSDEEWACKYAELLFEMQNKISEIRNDFYEKKEDKILENRGTKMKDGMGNIHEGLELYDDECLACPYWRTDVNGNRACWKEDYDECEFGIHDEN